MFDVIVGTHKFIHKFAVVNTTDTSVKQTGKMPFRCVLPTCGNTPDKEKCIALHKIPFFNDDRPEAKRRRKKWVDFINSKRADKWELNKNTTVCSVHFTRDSFIRKIMVPGSTPRLIVDDIGVVPYPTILESKKDEGEMSARTRRKVRGPKLLTWELHLSKNLSSIKSIVLKNV